MCPELWTEAAYRTTPWEAERIQDGNKDDPSAVLYFGQNTVCQPHNWLPSREYARMTSTKPQILKAMRSQIT